MVPHLPPDFLALTVLMNRVSLEGPQLFHCNIDSCLLHDLPPTFHVPSYPTMSMVDSDVCCFRSSVVHLVPHSTGIFLIQAAWGPDELGCQT